MEKHHIQSFLMASAAFFALNATTRPTQPLASSTSTTPSSAYVQNNVRNNAPRN